MGYSEKTEIRLKKVAERLRKTTYKGLTPEQKRYIKAIERWKQLNKDIDRFFMYAKRDGYGYGAVDWKNTSAEDIDLINNLIKERDRVGARVNRIEDSGKLDCELTMKFFRQINTHSESY